MSTFGRSRINGFPHYRSEHKQRVLSSNGFLSVIGGEPFPTPTGSAKAARVPSLSRSRHTQRVPLTQERAPPRPVLYYVEKIERALFGKRGRGLRLTTRRMVRTKCPPPKRRCFSAFSIKGHGRLKDVSDSSRRPPDITKYDGCFLAGCQLNPWH